ncbi:MAG: DUF1491 family protein [Hyphomicrobium sp.]
MRLRAEFWVKGYLRRCAVEGAAAVVVRHGDDDAGAIFIKINRLDGTCLLFAPAPAGLSGAESDRRWVAVLAADGVPESEVDGFLAREASFDPDLWLVEVEDRNGRHFLDDGLVGPAC